MTKNISPFHLLAKTITKYKNGQIESVFPKLPYCEYFICDSGGLIKELYITDKSIRLVDSKYEATYREKRKRIYHEVICLGERCLPDRIKYMPVFAKLWDEGFNTDSKINGFLDIAIEVQNNYDLDNLSDKQAQEIRSKIDLLYNSGTEETRLNRPLICDAE